MNDQSLETKKRGLGLEVVTVIIVAFGPILTTSAVWVFSSGESHFWKDLFFWSPGIGVVYFVVSTLLGLYVLSNRGESLRDCGFSLKPRVVPLSIGFFILIFLLKVVVSVAYDGFSRSSQPNSNRVVTESVISLGQLPLWFGAMYLMLGAFFEEFLSRAYLITRLRQMQWTKLEAVLASTLLASACHLYQGVDNALLHLPTFFVASIYFAYYRNATVIVIAHILVNASLVIWYAN